MKYMVSQKIFSIGDRFTIKNEQGEDCFVVQAKVMTIGRKLRMYDMQENELFYIEQKLLRFLPEYVIYQNGEEVATVKKKFTVLKSAFDITGKYGEITIDGNIIAHEFQMKRGGQPIANVSKQFFSFRDNYGVEILENIDDAFVMTLIIVIDQVLHPTNKNR